MIVTYRVYAISYKCVLYCFFHNWIESNWICVFVWIPIFSPMELPNLYISPFRISNLSFSESQKYDAYFIDADRGIWWPLILFMLFCKNYSSSHRCFCCISLTTESNWMAVFVCILNFLLSNNFQPLGLILLGVGSGMYKS